MPGETAYTPVTSPSAAPSSTCSLLIDACTSHVGCWFHLIIHARQGSARGRSGCGFGGPLARWYLFALRLYVDAMGLWRSW